MIKKAELVLDGKSFPLAISQGTDGIQGLNIYNLYEETGLVTIDPGYFNTASGVSEISRRDSETGGLTYRGYKIEDLTKNSTFVETSYLLIYGNLPTQHELADFSKRLSKHSLIHENMINLLDGFPGKAHPLAVLSVMVMSLSSYYPDEYEESLDKGIDLVTRLLAKIRTIAAFIYKKMTGQPFIYPQDRLPYCTNFLHMMFAKPTEPFEILPKYDTILNQLWILYAEHEMNVAAATVEMIGSTQANLFASISAGMSALWGSREGGRNVAAVEMIEAIIQNGGNVKKYFEKFKTGEAKLHSNGFGHKAYKVRTMRSIVVKDLFKNFYKNSSDPIVDIAFQIEDYVQNDPYFIQENLYPNLDFYSGVIFHSLGIPKAMFTVMQAIGKLPGWLAHWRQMRTQTKTSKARPRQIYTGKLDQVYIPIEKRN